MRYVDDSKATNPHAAAASLHAFEHVVWVAGGLLKGADVDDLVRDAAAAAAWRRPHRRRPRPDRRGAGPTRAGCPRRRGAEHGHWGHGRLVVARAADLAQPGDVVLLAPAAASMDMFPNYGARGDAFAAAVADGAAPGPQGE